MIKTDMFLRLEDLNYFYDGENGVEVDVALKGGDTSGSKIEFNFDTCVGSVPPMSGDNPRTISIDWTALATTSLEDEFELKFI